MEQRNILWYISFDRSYCAVHCLLPSMLALLSLRHPVPLLALRVGDLNS